MIGEWPVAWVEGSVKKILARNYAAPCTYFFAHRQHGSEFEGLSQSDLFRTPAQVFCGVFSGTLLCILIWIFPPRLICDMNIRLPRFVWYCTPYSAQRLWEEQIIVAKEDKNMSSSPSILGMKKASADVESDKESKDAPVVSLVPPVGAYIW